MAKAFISYKHDATPDVRLADHFVQYLTQQGHEVFIDKQIPLGENWSTVIGQKIEESNFLIVLLSEHSVASEMVIQEVSIAHSLKKERGSPTIIPIRVAYTVSYTQMPYKLGAMLELLQDTSWTEDGDEIEIGQKLDLAIGQNQPFQGNSSPVQNSNIVALACDGNPLQSDVKLVSPLPAFDPQWLKELDAPGGGAVRLESPFYVDRSVDGEAKEQLLHQGITMRLKGSRQIGKTSLLARLYQHANDNNYPIIYIDFQEMDTDQLRDLETLLRYLAERIADEQQTNASPNSYWQGGLGPKDKLTRFLGQEVLEQLSNPLVLIMDEVDRVFAFDEYRDDFFSLIRSWHNKRAFIKFKVWRKLNLVLAYSTEAFSFITDLNQSPFNVGIDFNLTDFDRTQVEALNWRHGSPIQTPQEMNSMMELLQGHPFLVRKALHTLTTQKLSVGDLITRACDEDGPFSDHLQYYLWRLNKKPELSQAMKSVIREKKCSNDLLFYQLRSSGLVRGSSRDNVEPRCGLYAQYFQKHL
jgi:hypothetical protein